MQIERSHYDGERTRLGVYARTAAMKATVRSRLLIDFAWALIFGLVGGIAVLLVERGHDLGGALSITLLTQPRALVRAIGGPDIDRSQWGPVMGAAVLSMVASFPVFLTASPANARRRTIAPIAIALAILLVGEIVYLVTGDVPREIFRGSRRGYLLATHFVALGLVGVYVVLGARLELPGWGRRAFWLLMFALALAVLFPITDSL